MKKITILISIGLLTLYILVSFTIQQSEIVGTWVSNNDTLWKISFSSNGIRKDYYENVLTDTYNYVISNNCGSQILTNELFIKTKDSLNETSCDVLNGIHNEPSTGTTTLSITSESGKLYLFTKQ